MQTTGKRTATSVKSMTSLTDSRESGMQGSGKSVQKIDWTRFLQVKNVT